MRIDDLKETIEEFIKGNNERAILINGEWGWGKTTQLKKAIADLKSVDVKKVYYCSIFGAQSVKDITICYNNVIEGLGNFAKAAFISTSALIPYAGQHIVSGLNNVLNDIKVPKIHKKCSIFVFDDLERVSPDFSYLEFFGLLNSLFSTGSRVICLSSSCNISDEKRNAEFKDFSEKIFDRIIEIHERPIDVAKSIVKQKCDLDLGDSAFHGFDGNLRKIIKAAALFAHIKENISKRNLVLLSVFTEEEIFIASLACVNIMFSKDDENPSFDNSDIGRHQQYVYNKYKSKYGKYGYAMLTGTRLEYYESKDKIQSLRDLIEAIFSVYAYNDFAELDTYKKIELSILEQPYFLLNDNDRLIYVDELVSYISGIQSFNQINKSIFRTSLFLLNQPDAIIKIEKKSIIRNKIFLFASKDRSTINEIEQLLILEEKEAERSFYNEFLLEVNEFTLQEERKSLVASFDSKLNNRDFKGLRDMLYDAYKSPLENAEKYELLVDHIEENHYFLPDFRKTLSYAQWDYSCMLVDSIFRLGNKDKLKKHLEEMKKLCFEKPSERDKYCALLERLETKRVS